MQDYELLKFIATFDINSNFNHLENFIEQLTQSL